MNILSIDVEFNQPSRKTIQLAGAVFDIKTGQLIEKFETYVNPHEPIAPFITELTGITDNDVSGAPDILDAYIMLKALHKKHKCFKNSLVWGSGVRNDSDAIYKEAYPTEESRIDNNNFMGYRVIDAKTVFQSIQLYHNKSFGGGLEKTCKTLKIGFEGDPHRALNDAINTFRVWHFMVKKFPEGFK